MNPNEQPRDFNTPSEPTPQPFGVPSQPETPTQPQTDFSPNPEPATPATEPVTDSTTTQSQPLGQPTEANQAPVPQPTFPSPEVPAANPQQPVSGENPGQTLGIISIVLSVVGFSLIGLILGIISRKKSKAAGASTTLGTVGMVMGIVFTVIGFLFFLLIALTAYAGIQDKAQEEANFNGGSSSQIYFE